MTASMKDDARIAPRIKAMIGVLSAVAESNVRNHEELAASANTEEISPITLGSEIDR